MENVKQLLVGLCLGKEEIEVGELVYHNRQIHFKYHSDFLKRGINISPFKLPFNNGIHTADPLPFDGLYGVFNDSLPDGWGRLLLDRYLIQKGVQLNKITPLDRLAYVGKTGRGSLYYSPSIKTEAEKQVKIELDKIASDVQVVLKGEASEVISQLHILGGSSGGARPKIFVGYNPQTNELIHGVDKLPPGFEHWIIKFPSSTDPEDIANIEMAYHKMAVDAGVEMTTCKLFKGKGGQDYFGTKRFDRIGNIKIHTHTAAGILHDNFRLSNIDYGHLMHNAFELEKDVEAYKKVFKLAVFNVLAHNRDDHSNNFSFLMDESGRWKFAPAYDLTFSSSSHGQHSTTINGEGSDPTKKHLFQLAHHFGLKNLEELFGRIQNSVFNWTQFAKNSGVSKESIKMIKKVINPTDS